jgi:hypothetical protein
MEGILIGLAALACPVGMGVMMWFMARGMRPKEERPTMPPSLDALREEHRRLGDEIERLQKDGRASGTRS